MTEEMTLADLLWSLPAPILALLWLVPLMGVLIFWRVMGNAPRTICFWQWLLAVVPVLNVLICIVGIVIIIDDKMESFKYKGGINRVLSWPFRMIHKLLTAEIRIKRREVTDE